MSEEEYLQKYNDGTLTQDEADDHNTRGPFSYLGYMQALLQEGFCGDKLCLALISMMWQISITVFAKVSFFYHVCELLFTVRPELGKVHGLHFSESGSLLGSYVHQELV